MGESDAGSEGDAKGFEFVIKLFGYLNLTQEGWRNIIIFSEASECCS